MYSLELLHKDVLKKVNISENTSSDGQPRVELSLGVETVDRLLVHLEQFLNEILDVVSLDVLRGQS